MGNKKIKAKVLQYEVLYHGIHCGRAKLKLLEGDNKGKTLTIPTVDHYKQNQTITIRESII